MKKRFISFLCLLSLFIFTSCDLLGGSLKDYINEYTKNAALELYEVLAEAPRDAAGTRCLTPSDTVALYLRNPMGYEIELEYEFYNPVIQSIYDDYYKEECPIVFTNVTEDNSMFTMQFGEAFLSNIDTYAYRDVTRSKDVSGTVYAYEKETHRPFGSIDINLHADTIPSVPTNTMMQLDQDPEGENASQAHYIVCFEICRSPCNNDFNRLTINGDSWDISYDYYGDYVTDGIQAQAADGNKGTLFLNPDPEDLPSGCWPVQADSDIFEPVGRNGDIEYETFYYVSADRISDKEITYTITIADDAGLFSTANISNKQEKLAPVNFTQTVTQGQIFLADIDNEMKLTIKPGDKTTEGSSLNTIPYIEYMIETVDDNGNILDSGEWKRVVTTDGAITLSLAPTAYVDRATLKFYRISARTKGNGYLTSDVVTLPDFEVLRSNHFFVNQSGDDNNQGTLTSSYKTFNNTIMQIAQYSNWISDLYEGYLPADGFYLYLVGDYAADYNDFTNDYLIECSEFSGKLTIQGVDQNGKTLSNGAQATISAEEKGSILYWPGSSQPGSTLILKNLSFENAMASGHNGAAMYIGDTASNAVTVTLSNCTFRNNTLTDTELISGGAALAIETANNNSKVTIEDCTFTQNLLKNTAYGTIYIIKGDTASDATGLVEIKGNTTITNNTSEGSAGTGINCNGRLTLCSNTVEITGNTSGEPWGGTGLLCGLDSTVIIKGAKIYGNTNSAGNASNVFIAWDPDFGTERNTLKLEGKLSSSKIYVSTAYEPEEGQDPVPFATYTTKPDTDVFFSDSGLPVKLGATSATMGGKLAHGKIAPIADNITLLITTGNDNSFTILCFKSSDLDGYLDESGWADAERINTDMTNGQLTAYTISDVNYSVMYYGAEIQSSSTTWSAVGASWYLAAELGDYLETSDNPGFVISIEFKLNGKYYSLNYIPFY